MTKPARLIYILRYAHRENIRRLEFNKPHGNPGTLPKQVVGKLHKHKWTDAYGDEWAYEPTDIENPWDPRRSLGNFLSECNIEFKADQLGSLQVQGGWM